MPQLLILEASAVEDQIEKMAISNRQKVQLLLQPGQGGWVAEQISAFNSAKEGHGQRS